MICSSFDLKKTFNFDLVLFETSIVGFQQIDKKNYSDIEGGFGLDWDNKFVLSTLGATD